MPVQQQMLNLFATLALSHAAIASAQERPQTAFDDAPAPRVANQPWSHIGLLRARDLTPFGLLRLDMLPAHTADAEVDAWTFEAQSYQNTYVLSDNARDYLESRNIGRQPVRSQDAAGILALPDDAYLIDGEVGLADLIVQRRTSEYWSVYITIP